MAMPVIMPRQGQSVESCIITKWHKNEGDIVKEGELLFSYETDKAAFEEEAKAEGTLLKIFYGEGEDVPVLVNVCVIGTPGEDISSLKGSDGEAQIPDGSQKGVSLNGRAADDENAGESASVLKQSDTDIAGVGSKSGHAAISPRARNKAAAGNIDIRLAEPTGPYGRIIERDIDKAAEKAGFFERASISDDDIAGRTVSAA
ncbi:MAG: E3 binding domain-containing protein, partial [Eubacteriales bacterium]|nr:E3 binding domain-containing protein [Eubacteriales bacterium]